MFKVKSLIDSAYLLTLTMRQASADDRQKSNTFCKKCQNYGISWPIWNHHEKCIQVSTSMLSIGLVIPEITCEMLEFGENKHNFAQ